MNEALTIPPEEITVEDVLFLLPAIDEPVERRYGALRHPTDGYSCPLCALAHAFGSATSSRLDYHEACDALGIPREVGRRIANAADNVRSVRCAELEAYLR